MKIVLDTNLLVSGIFWRGTPSKILDLWTQDKITFCVSEDILDEYLEVIQRLQKKYGTPKDVNWYTLVQEKTIIFMVDSTREYSRDPDDDKFIHCALASKAIYIVSGDQDLLVLEKVDNVDIITASEFLERYERPMASKSARPLG
jgi:uncharacterized protein